MLPGQASFADSFAADSYLTLQSVADIARAALDNCHALLPRASCEEMFRYSAAASQGFLPAAEILRGARCGAAPGGVSARPLCSGHCRWAAAAADPCGVHNTMSSHGAFTFLHFQIDFTGVASGVAPPETAP